MVNELENVTIGNVTLPGGILSNDINVIGSIIIAGDITAEPGAEITITGYEFFVEPDVFIGPNVNLIPGFPNGCGEPISPSSINLSSYCTNGTYKANQASALVGNTSNDFSNYEIREEQSFPNKNLEEEFNTKVYPNPSMDGTFNLAIMSSKLNQNIVVIISDATGKEVYQTTNSILQYDEIKIDLSNQSKGFYFIQITDEGDNRYFEKVVIE